jgi:hypothetical protein
MKIRAQLTTAALLLTAPLAAYAQGAPHILMASFGGGAVGGFFGGLLACWLCKRNSRKTLDTEPKRH